MSTKLANLFNPGGMISLEVNNQLVIRLKGGPPKWMVKIMENPIKMGWFGGFSHIFGNTHIYTPSVYPHLSWAVQKLFKV